MAGVAKVPGPLAHVQLDMELTVPVSPLVIVIASHFHPAAILHSGVHPTCSGTS